MPTGTTTFELLTEGTAGLLDRSRRGHGPRRPVEALDDGI